eukprot:12036747-Karenia_brevis.AAC.1
MAGVKGKDWLLMDDILSMDCQVLEMHGILSDVFVLGCGTAQGRRFSLHVFNGLMRFFAGDLDRAVMGGPRTLLLPFAGRALRMAAQQRKPALPTSVPSSSCSLDSAIDNITRVHRHDTAPWHLT